MNLYLDSSLHIDSEKSDIISVTLCVRLCVCVFQVLVLLV